MNFTVAMVTPVMITNIGYKTYITFMCFCIAGFFFSIFVSVFEPPQASPFFLSPLADFSSCFSLRSRSLLTPRSYLSSRA